MGGVHHSDAALLGIAWQKGDSLQRQSPKGLPESRHPGEVAAVFWNPGSLLMHQEGSMACPEWLNLQAGCEDFLSCIVKVARQVAATIEGEIGFLGN